MHGAVPAPLLREASIDLKDIVPDTVMDSGVENVNSMVDALRSEGIVKRVLAQVDIVQSNSMIESWWRQLKHQWLYLNTLDSIESVRKLVTFYAEQHNSVVPHYAFQGQTPDEMYFNQGTDIPAKLKVQCASARAARMKHNRALQCSKCRLEESPKLVTIENNTSLTKDLFGTCASTSLSSEQQTG